MSLRDPRNDFAWREFVEIYSPLVERQCRRYGLQTADSLDVTQDVMLAVVSAIRTFTYDPQKGRFRHWLLTVVRSKLIDFFNNVKRHPRGTGETSVQRLLEAQPNAEEVTQWEIEYQRRLFHWAAEVVRKDLHESTWEAFRQTTIEDRPAPEVARSLNLRIGAVYTAKSRVLARVTALIRTVAHDA